MVSDCLSLPVITAEPEEPDHDDQPLGGAILAGLQAAVGPGRVRRGQHASCPFRSHLET